MIEMLSLLFIVLLCISLYINETTLHKNKIEFDLLKDRNKKEIKK